MTDNEHNSTSDHDSGLDISNESINEPAEPSRTAKLRRLVVIALGVVATIELVVVVVAAHQ
ncbi:MAG: hypothetical protein H7123_04070 [Thermoleophilia bacterium]|nr:hypothetical protein [Thermoleophilia bacterium]